MTSRRRTIRGLAFAVLAALPSLLGTAAALLSSTPPAAAQASDPLAARIDQSVERLAPAIVELRHRLHQNPELSNREVQTAALIADHLRKLGLNPRTGVAKTGVVALLEGGKPGPLIAVRADMDALPVTEATDLPFKSTRRDNFLGQEVGVAHACGHDIHVSSLLGAASVLAAMRQDLPGSILFLFQPAEEGPPPGERGGAEVMLEEGVFRERKPAAVFALHSSPDLQVGQVGSNPGPALAAVDQFVVKIRGKQSHGAYPHLSVDPVVIAAQAVLALQTIRSRNIPALEPSVLTVGIIRGGERFNIIPGEVHLEGTVRTYNPQVRDDVERRMREILAGITSAAGGTFEMDYKRNAPATVNDPALTARVQPIFERILGAEQVKTTQPTMAGEDFSFFSNQVPGLIFWLGVVKPGTTSGGLHTPNFRADDGAVPVGMRVLSRLLVDYLRENP